MMFELPLTREFMADYLGLSLETVSREISSLRREEIIRLEGKRGVIIPNIKELAIIAGDDTDGGVLG